MSAAVTAPSIACAWDHLADSYDEVFTNSAIGRAQRAAVQRHALQAFRPGSHIVELNCGTGVDAVFLARHGITVDAFDVSSRMVERARAAAHASGLKHHIRVEILPTESLDQLEAGYDGAFSNFSGLNCVADLAAVARELARVLRPGSPALLCLSTRVCAWEIAWYGLHGDLRTALRRLRGSRVETRIAGAPVHVHYPSMSQLRRQFAPHFQLKQVTGIGVAVPPSYVEHLASRFPRLLHMAVAFDARANRLPLLRIIGDHMLLQFERCA